MATTLGDLKDKARQRSDMVNNPFIAEDELTTYINESYKELYDIIVSKFEDYYVSGPVSFSLGTGESTYALPSDFYKLLGVDRSLGGDDYYTIRPFNFEQRNSRRSSTLYRGIYPNIQYRLVGDYLRFNPEDLAQGDYRLWYVPTVTALANDSDSIGIELDKWAEFIVVSAAIKMLAKEESDPSVLMSQKAELKRRIEEMAANRDVGESMRVTDVTMTGYDDPLYYRTY